MKYYNIIIALLVMVPASRQQITAQNKDAQKFSVSNFLQETGCAVHIANYLITKSKPFLEKRNEFSTSFPGSFSEEELIIGQEKQKQMEAYESILESSNLNNIPHSFTNPSLWSIKHSYHSTVFPSLKYKISGCVTFLVIEPSLDQILESIQYSGFFVEPDTPFFLYYLSQSPNLLTIEHLLNKEPKLGKIQGGESDESNLISWKENIMTSDVSVLFLIEEDLRKKGTRTVMDVSHQHHQQNLVNDVRVFCYFCEKMLVKNPILISGENVTTAPTKDLLKMSRQMNEDAISGQNIAVDKSWWTEYPVKCDPFSHKKQREAFTCFPQGKIILNILMRRYNVTPIFPGDAEVFLSLFYSEPFFGVKHPMIVFPSPLARSDPYNYSKSFLYNSSTDRLFYCVSQHEACQGLFSLMATLTQPFQPSVWASLLISTGLMIFILKPKDPIGLICIILGQGYSKLRAGKGATFRKGLLLFWSLLISTSVSFLYDGLLTADMLVPMPDTVIGSIRELIFKGFKIGYMIDFNISQAWTWYEHSFNRSGLQDKINSSFLSVGFDDSIYERLVNMSGKLTIFREEIETEAALHKIQEQVWRLGKRVKCHQVGEPLLPNPGMNTYTATFFFHMSTAFQGTMNRIFETGILNELTKIAIWQRSKLPRKPWELGDHQFKPSGFSRDSKILVIFQTLGFGLGFAVWCIVGEMMVSCVFGRKRN